MYVRYHGHYKHTLKSTPALPRASFNFDTSVVSIVLVAGGTAGFTTAVVAGCAACGGT